jgi:acylglycerol kinase
MAKFVATLRSHWKKSILFSLVGAYGVHRGDVKWEEHRTMKAFCLEAMEYGQVSQPVSAPLYCVTVILNPAASKGSARSKFENYCAPILSELTT